MAAINNKLNQMTLSHNMQKQVGDGGQRSSNFASRNDSQGNVSATASKNMAASSAMRSSSKRIPTKR